MLTPDQKQEIEDFCSSLAERCFINWDRDDVAGLDGLHCTWANSWRQTGIFQMHFSDDNTLTFDLLALEHGFTKQGVFEKFTLFFPSWARANGFDQWEFDVSQEGFIVFKKAGFPIAEDNTVQISLATPPPLALSYEEWVQAGKPDPEPAWRADL